MIEPAARARLERWKQSILDLLATGPLLDAADGPTTIPLPATDPLRLAAALAQGALFTLESGPASPEAGAVAALGPQGATGVLRSPLTRGELNQRAHAIRRAARDALAAGEHTLWLGLGMLTWSEAPDAVAKTAPLALWPVALTRGAGGLRLVEAAGIEPRANHALGERLMSSGELAAALAADRELDLAALLAAADTACAANAGWRLERGAQLIVSSLAPFAMWRALDARSDSLLDHELIARLAESPAESLVMTDAQPAAELCAPLDADANQLAAIAAAAAGASFVLDGPAGTGKSQTIANLIAHCTSAGKTVLVVADRTAALDAIHRRLAAVGLGELCLALYSPKALRADVVGQLGRVLDRAFRPVAGPAVDAARLDALRGSLDGHVAALHRVGPFGRSLHEVLGRLIELRAAPTAGLAELDATGLDRAAFDHRKHSVEQLALAAAEVEPVASHPWRASTMERWAADARPRALAALDEAGAACAALSSAVSDVVRLIPGLVAKTSGQLAALGALAAAAQLSPRPGAELLTQVRAPAGDDVVEKIALIRARGAGSVEPPREPGTFLVLAARHRLLATEVNDRFTDSVAELDAPVLWAQLRRWLHRMAPLRFVALRDARAAVRAAAMPGMLETDGAMITALESVIAERAVRAALVAAGEPARRWFGALGGEPLALDLSRIDAAVEWAVGLRRAFEAVEVAHGESGRAAAWRALVAQVAAHPAESPGSGELAVFTRLAEATVRWQAAVAALAAATGIAETMLAAGDDHLAVLGERVVGLRRAIGGMFCWVAFHGARRAAQAAGVGPAIPVIERGELAAAELATAWERATLLAWAAAELADAPALAAFDGAAHHAEVAAFAELDRQALGSARRRVQVRFAEGISRVTPEPGRELGALLHELKAGGEASRSNGVRPLRRLLAQLPTLLPKLAPCVLATPQSVAELFEPPVAGEPAIAFDIVVVDQAAELSTAEALAALARGQSVVVAGDGQLVGSGLLADCVAAGLPVLRLARHYRSKHEDLIAFANRHSYDDALEVLPAPHGGPELGVSWRRIDGSVDPAAQHNRAEADAIVADVLARLRDPAQRNRSIAIVALTRGQQALIEDGLDAARAADPTLDEPFESVEPVVVEHIEALRADERDVIILSVGTSAGADGAVSDFGALSQPGGEHRLTQAITRAREQLIVVSSVAPEDVARHDEPAGAALADAEASGDADATLPNQTELPIAVAVPPPAPSPLDAPGVRALAALLGYARAGGGSVRRAQIDAPAPASPITAAIAGALAERGWTVHHQVGCGAYRLELAVVDPNDPERYVLAVEHDGAAYASASAARDRDRLRGQLLGQLGWRIHRIWTLDWWLDPERELARVHGAIVTAVAASRARRTSGSVRPAPRAARPSEGSGPARPAAASQSARIVRPADSRTTGKTPVAPLAAGSGPTDAVAALIAEASAPIAGGSAPIRLAKNTISIGPYLAAAIPAGRRVPDDLFTTRHMDELGKIVDQVLAAEAPIHIDVLARRVGAYFGIGKPSQAVTDQVRLALYGRGQSGDEIDVIWRLDQDPTGVPGVRVAGQGASARRSIDEVPLCEVASAARIVVERANDITAADLVRDAARLLGFARLTDPVVERVAVGVRLAVQRALIQLASGRATLPES